MLTHKHTHTHTHTHTHNKTATLFVRPRGLHLDEAHVLVGGQPVAGGLFDLCVYLYHNAVPLLAKGSGPYLYIPKIEYHREARWWNEAFEVGVCVCVRARVCV